MGLTPLNFELIICIGMLTKYDVFELVFLCIEHQTRNSGDLRKFRKQMAMFRHVFPIPSLFTLRGRDQGGLFGGSEDDLLELLIIALKMGFEMIEIDDTWSERIQQEVIQMKGNTKVRCYS
jgi:3-dehydroquinate dehydratase